VSLSKVGGHYSLPITIPSVSTILFYFLKVGGPWESFLKAPKELPQSQRTRVEDSTTARGQKGIFFQFCHVAKLAIIDKNNLAKFGYRPDVTVKIFKNSSHFWLHATTK
jgi:hypothetical protein